MKKTSEYNCGEKDEIELSAYYFKIDAKVQKAIFIISIFLFLAIIGGGLGMGGIGYGVGGMGGAGLTSVMNNYGYRVWNPQ